MVPVEGKLAIVTDSDRGVAAGCAVALACTEASVAVVHVDQDDAATLGVQGGRAVALGVDTAEPASAVAVADATPTACRFSSWDHSAWLGHQTIALGGSHVVWG